MLIVVIANITGTQGQAVVERFKELGQLEDNADNSKLIIRGLTRNKESPKAKDLLKRYENIELYNVDYDDASTLEEPFYGANALLVNLIMSKNEPHQYKQMIDAAIKSSTLRHLIYSSSGECQLDHGVPHWETSWGTEQYLNTLQQQHKDLTYHILRYFHCNENMITYYKPTNEFMPFPFDPAVKVYTASVRDGARVACKLFLDPSLLPSGGILDIATEFCSPQEMAEAVSKAMGQPIQAYKGPWILLNIVHHLAFEPKTIKIMGEWLEIHSKKEMIQNPNKLHDFLKDEIENGDTLETVQQFCQRHFASGDRLPSMLERQSVAKSSPLNFFK